MSIRKEVKNSLAGIELMALDPRARLFESRLKGEVTWGFWYLLLKMMK